MGPQADQSKLRIKAQDSETKYNQLMATVGNVESTNHMADYSGVMRQYITNQAGDGINNQSNSSSGEDSDKDIHNKTEMLADIISNRQALLDATLKTTCANLSKLSLNAYQITEMMQRMLDADK